MIKNRVVLLKVLLNLFLIGLLVSCGGDGAQSNQANTVNGRALEKVSILNFEEDFRKIKEERFKEDLTKLAQKYPLFFASKRPDSEWEIRFRNKELSAFSDSLIDLFEHKISWKEQLNKAIEVYQREFVNDVMPEVFIWNSVFEMQEGVWEYDNYLIVAMEQYMGEDHPFYIQTPRYIAKQKDHKYLVRDIVKGFGNSKVNADPDDFTFLNKMLIAGRAYYFTKRMLGDIPEDILMKYPKEKLEWAQENEAEIWKYFINQELLYSTQSKPEEYFLSEAPFSKFGQDFDNKTPGRIGEWIGLQIIESLAKNNPDMSLETIMGIEDAQAILTLSKYKP